MKRSFLLNNCLLSLSTKTRIAIYVVEILHGNIPLTEMLSSLKVAKKYIHLITLMGSNSRAGICVAWLKLTTLGRRIVNRLY